MTHRYNTRRQALPGSRVTGMTFQQREVADKQKRGRSSQQHSQEGKL